MSHKTPPRIPQTLRKRTVPTPASASNSDNWVDIPVGGYQGNAPAFTAFTTQATDYQTSEMWRAGPRVLNAATVSEEPANITFTLDPQNAHQRILGYGAAMTDASAYNIINHEDRETILDDLFLSPENGGAGIGFLRVPLGACDFSVAPPDGGYVNRPTPDVDFDFSREERGIVPMLKAAMQRNPTIKIMLSPWSSAPWMKDSGQMAGGRLLPEYFEAHAAVMVDSVKHFMDAGIDVWAISYQNEPGLETSYPSMDMSIEEQVRLCRILVAALRSNDLETRVLIHDFNYNAMDNCLGVLDNVSDIIDGTAWHVYGGEDPSILFSQPKIRAAGIYHTEQTGAWDRPRDADYGSQWWMQKFVLTGPALIGSKSGLEWNLALDDFGPVLPGGPTNCRGILGVRKGEAHDRSPEHYALMHQNHAQGVSGAWRIESWHPDMECVAYSNDQGEVGALVINEWDGPAVASFVVPGVGEIGRLLLPVNSVSSIRWEALPKAYRGPAPLPDAVRAPVMDVKMPSEFELVERATGETVPGGPWTAAEHNKFKHISIRSTSSGKFLDTRPNAKTQGASATDPAVTFTAIQPLNGAPLMVVARRGEHAGPFQVISIKK